MEWMYPRVGERLRQARVERGLTQEALGQAIGLTRTSVVNIERGRQKVMLHTLYAVAEALRVSLMDLLPSPTEASIEERLSSDPVAQQDPSVLKFWEQARARSEGE